MRKDIWPDSETAELIRLRGLGKTAGEVAKALGRSRDSVCGKIERLMAAGRAIPASRIPARGGRKAGIVPPPAEPTEPPKDYSDMDRVRWANWRRAKVGAREALGV